MRFIRKTYNFVVKKKKKLKPKRRTPVLLVRIQIGFKWFASTASLIIINYNWLLDVVWLRNCFHEIRTRTIRMASQHPNLTHSSLKSNFIPKWFREKIVCGVVFFFLITQRKLSHDKHIFRTTKRTTKLTICVSLSSVIRSRDRTRIRNTTNQSKYAFFFY